MNWKPYTRAGLVGVAALSLFVSMAFEAEACRRARRARRSNCCVQQPCGYTDNCQTGCYDGCETYGNAQGHQQGYRNGGQGYGNAPQDYPPAPQPDNLRGSGDAGAPPAPSDDQGPLAPGGASPSDSQGAPAPGGGDGQSAPAPPET